MHPQWYLGHRGRVKDSKTSSSGLLGGQCEVIKGICLHLKCPRCWIRTNHEVWPPWGMPCRAARTRTTPAAQMTRGSPEQQGVLAPLKSSARCVWPADIIGIRALSVPSQTSAKKRSTDRRQAAWVAYMEQTPMQLHRVYKFSFLVIIFYHFWVTVI